VDIWAINDGGSRSNHPRGRAKAMRKERQQTHPVIVSTDAATQLIKEQNDLKPQAG
tara:strand:+ start:277 stop:444 length:168 start_codon:yes stop_codon:yes gene_type:complete